MTLIARALLLLNLLLVVGCSTPSVPVPAPETAAEAAADAATPGQLEAAVPPAAPARPSPDNATLALLNQSDRAALNGDLDEALSYAERAVRIDPRRADLWTRLAELELRSGDAATAIRYAQKALSLAAGSPGLTRDAWLVIADAKEATGAADEAADIRQRWQTARG